jgi:hypothetical protein
MGTFAETAITDYHLLFADQGKQTFVFCFCLHQTNGSCSFPLVLFSVFNMLPFQTENGKRKPRWFLLTHLPYAHHANGSLSLIRLLTKRQMEV